MGDERRTERVVRAWFDAFATEDLESARSLLAGDAIVHSYEPPELAGDFRGGLDEFLGWYARKRELAGPGFGYEVEEILGGERFAVALLRLHSHDGGGAEWRQVAVYRVDEDRITEIWLYEEPKRLRSGFPAD